MRFCIIFLLLFPQSLSSQIQTDSINGERLYEYKNLSILNTPDSITFPFFQIDTLTKTPINGWIKNKGGKSISFEHYKNGLSNGRYVQYEFIDNNYKKTYECLRYIGWTYEDYNYKWKSDSLTLVKMSYKNWTEDYRLRRDIKIKANKYNIKDNYYFYESSKNKIIRYKLDSIDHLKSNLRGMYFPNRLNKIENPFTAIRLDGYYNRRVETSKKNVAKWYPKPDTLYPKYYNENDTTYLIDSTFSYDIKIRFYSDGTFRQINVKLSDDFTDWSSDEVFYGDYIFEGNSIKSENLKPGFEIKKASFYGVNHNIIECGYPNTVKHRYVFDFVAD